MRSGGSIGPLNRIKWRLNFGWNAFSLHTGVKRENSIEDCWRDSALCGPVAGDLAFHGLRTRRMSGPRRLFGVQSARFMA